jgi:hypothetical protein
MSNHSFVKIAIYFNDPNLDAEERDNEAQNLLSQLESVDEAEDVNRVSITNLPDSSKSLSGWVVGALTTEVNAENFKKLILFLGDRLSGKSIELEVEFNGSKLKIKASSKAGLDAAVASAQTFVETLKAQKIEGQRFIDE